jgi:hypothetical protein
VKGEPSQPVLRRIQPVGLLVVGFVLASAVAFGSVRALGVLTGLSHIPLHARELGAVIGSAALLLVDLSRFRMPVCPLTLHRQTPKWLIYDHGPLAPLLWGLDTGAVVTTIRLSALTWMGLGLVLLGIGPWWSGVAYAAGFCVPLAALIVGPRWRAQAGEARNSDPQWLTLLLTRHRMIARSASMAVGSVLVLALVWLSCFANAK